MCLRKISEKNCLITMTFREGVSHRYSLVIFDLLFIHTTNDLPSRNIDLRRLLTIFLLLNSFFYYIQLTAGCLLFYILDPPSKMQCDWWTCYVLVLIQFYECMNSMTYEFCFENIRMNALNSVDTTREIVWKLWLRGSYMVVIVVVTDLHK